jgi:hypothetical protein
LGYAAIDSAGFLDSALSRSQTIGRDFVIFWSAAVLLLRGDAATLFDPAQFQPALDGIVGQTLAFMPYPYPPHSIFVIWPLGLLPFIVAWPLWLGSTFALVATLLRRFQVGWLAILALLLSPASIVNICSGQNGYLSAALLCGGLLLLERRPVLAGVLIGVLSYKPQLGLLLPLLLIVGGHWRCFLAASMTVVVLVVGSIAVVGVAGWQTYLGLGMPEQIDFLQHGSGFFQQMSFTYFMNARLLGADLGLAWLLQVAMAVLIGIASILIFRGRAAHELKVATALVATTLISPYVLSYDLVIVGVAILLAARHGPWSLGAQGVFALAWLLPIAAILPVPPFTAGVLTLLFFTLWYRARNA